MSLDRMPLKFIVFIDYDRELMRRTIRVGIDSRSDDDVKDLVSEDGVKEFIDNVAMFFDFPLTEKEIVCVAERLALKTLDQNATEKEIKEFVERIIEKVEELIDRTREKEKETEYLAFSFDVDVPIMTYGEMVNLIGDRVYTVHNWIDKREPTILDKSYDTFTDVINNDMSEDDKQPFYDIKNLLGEIISVFPNHSFFQARAENHKKAKTIIDEIINVINNDSELNTKWLRKKIIEIDDLVLGIDREEGEEDE